MYAIVQYPKPNSPLYRVVRLSPGAYKSSAGYIVGQHSVILPRVTLATARRIVAALKTDECKTACAAIAKARGE